MKNRGGSFLAAVYCAAVFANMPCMCMAESEDSMASPPDQTIDFEARLEQLGIELPQAAPPAANYVKAVRVGDVLYLSGHAAVTGFRGKLGKDITTAEGYQAARSTAVSVIATLKQELGDLNRVRRIVKVMGMVNSTADYAEQHLVMNGFSDLIVELFGDRGRHARSAVGMGSLPLAFAVEVDVIVQVEDLGEQAPSPPGGSP